MAACGHAACQPGFAPSKRVRPAAGACPSPPLRLHLRLPLLLPPLLGCRLMPYNTMGAIIIAGVLQLVEFGVAAELFRVRPARRSLCRLLLTGAATLPGFSMAAMPETRRRRICRTVHLPLLPLPSSSPGAPAGLYCLAGRVPGHHLCGRGVRAHEQHRPQPAHPHPGDRLPSHRGAGPRRQGAGRAWQRPGDRTARASSSQSGERGRQQHLVPQPPPWSPPRLPLCLLSCTARAMCIATSSPGPVP